MPTIDEALGIDPNDPIQRNAYLLVESCYALVNDLKARRIAQGLTIEEVSERMGIAPESVRGLEGSRGTDMRLTTLRRYALAVGAVVAFTVGPFDATNEASS